MNREQQERVENLGREIVNAITDVIDSNTRPQESLESGEDFTPGDNEIHEVRDGACTMIDPEPSRNTSTAYRAAYEPIITQVNNGFTVRCGCQTFVFETFEKMSKYLKMYFENPAETEEKFYKNELF